MNLCAYYFFIWNFFDTVVCAAYLVIWNNQKEKQVNLKIEFCSVWIVSVTWKYLNHTFIQSTFCFVLILSTENSIVVCWTFRIYCITTCFSVFSMQYIGRIKSVTDGRIKGLVERNQYLIDCYLNPLLQYWLC